MLDVLCRFVCTWVWSYPLAALEGLRPEPMPEECGNAIEELGNAKKKIRIHNVLRQGRNATYMDSDIAAGRNGPWGAAVAE